MSCNFECEFLEATDRELLHKILHKLQKQEAHMSALDDKIATIVAAVTQLGTDLGTLVADLKANNGAPTPAQLSALDGIVTSLTSLDTTVKSDDPGTPTPPAV